MKKALILNALLALQVLVFAQTPNFKIKWNGGGAMTTFKPTSSLDVFIGSENIILAKRRTGGYELECYDADLRYTNASKLSDISGGDDDKQFYFATFEFGGKLYQLNTVNNYKVDKSVSVIAAELSVSKMKYGKVIELAKQYPMYAIYWKGAGAKVAFSPDKSKVAFLFKENGENGILVKVYDTQFTEIQSNSWQPTSPVVSSMNSIVIGDFIVDNNGNVIWQVELGTTKEVRKATGHTYQIGIVYFPVVGKVVANTIESGNNVINGLRLKITPSGSVVAAGFYSEVGVSETYNLSMPVTGRSVKGTFYSSYNVVTNKFDKVTFNPFSESYRNKFKYKGKRELPEIYLHDIEVTAEGEVVIMGEQLMNASELLAMVNGENWDIIVVKLNKNGSVVFEANIPKRQAASMIGMHEINRTAPAYVNFTQGYYSFVHAIENNKLRIIYNDHQKNLAIDDGNKLLEGKGISNISTIVAEFDLTTGKYKRYELFNGIEAKVMMYPLYCKAVSFNRFVFLAARHDNGEMKEYKLGEITFN